MDLIKFRNMTGKQKGLALLLAFSKITGLVFAILTVHLVSHLLQEVFSGEEVLIATAVLNILATVAVRVALIKIAADSEHRLSLCGAADASVLPYLFYAVMAPVVLFAAVFEISALVATVLLVSAAMLILFSRHIYLKTGKGPAYSPDLKKRYILDAGVCCGMALGIILALAGVTKGEIGISGAFIILLHAADFFRPGRQLFLLLDDLNAPGTDRKQDTAAGSDDRADLYTATLRKDLILSAAIDALGWIGHILVVLFGSIGIVTALAGEPTVLHSALICVATVLYCIVRLIEDRRNQNNSAISDNLKYSFLKKALAAVFVGIVMIPVIVRVHPMLGIQLLVSYGVLGIASVLLGRAFKNKAGTAEALTEGIALLLDTLMLVSALIMHLNGGISPEGLLIAVVALVGSVGPFIAVGEEEEEHEEDIEASDSF